MKNTSRPLWSQISVVAALTLAGYVTLSSDAAAQTGNNAVYNSSGNCSPSSPCASSPAFIDATVFITSPPPLSRNFCGVLNYMLNPLNAVIPSFGAVIDARGLNSGNTSMTCTTTNPSPWAGITNPPPSTILLPATTPTAPAAPISIPSTWTLPPNTHLIGEGDSIASSTTISTTIQAQSSFSGSMIQLGSVSCIGVPPFGSSCTGISVENLTLDGQGQSINGIVNPYAADQSYIDHVSLYQILGTGLSVSGSASNSGPYSNIKFDLGSVSGTSSTVCASINGLSGTHGIHGLTCTATNNDPPAAVLLDSSNNSIEDVRIVGFYDGILVGSNASAHGNVLLNIVGDTGREGIQPPVHVVHISSNNSVTDLSVMGVNNVLGNPINGEYSIEDDVTSTTLGDSYVGVYAIGNKGTGNNYYSRFTTSPNAASWIVGPSAPSGSCTEGSLYSCVGSSGNGSACMHGSAYYALWACANNSSGSLVWLPVL